MIQLEIDSAATADTPKTMTVNIGGVIKIFKVKTAPAPDALLFLEPHADALDGNTQTKYDFSGT